MGDNQETKDILQRMSNGDFDDAFKIAVRKMENSNFLSENFDLILKICVILKKEEIISKLLNSLSNLVLEENTAIRITTLFPHLSSGIKRFQLNKSSYKWVLEYKNSGEDKLYEPDIKNLGFINNSYPVYSFGLECNCCSRNFNTVIRGSFFIHRETFCPSCLSRNLIKYNHIKTFIETNYSNLVGANSYQYDFPMLGLKGQLDESLFDESIPILAHYLGQDTIFALNQVIIEELLTKK